MTAVRGTNLLSAKQRSWIEGEARGAWKRMSAAGAIDEPYNEWRVREAVSMCGFRISEAPKAAFDGLLSHFQALNGKTDKAMERLSGPSNGWHFWHGLIEEQLARGVVGRGYLDFIVCDRGITSLEKATEKQMRDLFVTLRNRINAKVEFLKANPDAKNDIQSF